ncbi:MAG: patatin family protein [Oleiphilaceae bacterium]|nr:patatin family protein [Oleiphilaceae bacterium]
METVTSTGKHALVVEGGAMRGIFASGVLDGFLQHHYHPFHFCLGVSAGSTNLAAWLAGQQERNYRVITDYSCRPEFMRLGNFLRGGHWLDLDWLWEITIREIRLDLETFARQNTPLIVVTTAVSDGQARYIEATAENLENLLKASCSVPLLYRDYPVINGEAMTDGGVADSIPVIRAYEMGARDITVVLSHPDGYCKGRSRAPWLIRRLLKDQPVLAQALIRRADSYNRAMDFIRNPPADCRIHRIAPPEAFPVGRLTRNTHKLNTGYHMGLEAAKAVAQAQPPGVVPAQPATPSLQK